MWKVISLNAVIPLISLMILVFDNLKIDNQRLLPIKYRIWMFDYGFYVFLVQFIILCATCFICKEKNGQLVAFAIFFIWIIIGFILSDNTTLFD